MDQTSITRSSLKAARQATSSAMASTFDALSDIKSKSFSLIEFDTKTSESKSEVTEPNDETSTSSSSIKESPDQQSGKTPPNFFRSLSFKKARSLIKSIPNQLPGSSPIEEAELSLNDSTESTQKKSSVSTLNSVSETASSVFNKINPFESTNSNNNNNTKNQKEKQNLFLVKLEKLEKTFGFLEDNSPSCSEEEEEVFEVKSDNRQVTYEDYANIQGDSNMLENFNTPDHENSSLLAQSGSLKRKVKPIGSLEYTVGENNETIEKIALKWNTVPSEIQRLNRLSTRMLFPGQIIYVPDPEYVPSPNLSATPILLSKKHLSSDNLSSKSNSQSTPPTSGFSIFNKWKSTSAKPGHPEPTSAKVIRQSTISDTPRHHTISETEAERLDQECMQRFLKINCKIVTYSKGCHDGVIIITPSAVMFDPLNADEIVPSRHPSSSSTPQSTIYDEASAIIPIELISNVIMYEDLQLKDVQEYFEYQQQRALLEYEIISNGGLSCNHSINDYEMVNSMQSSSNNEVNFEVGEEVRDLDNPEQNNSNSTVDQALIETELSNALSEEAGDENQPAVADVEAKTEKKLNSCYLCIKVNHNKNVMEVPMDRKMKNKLRSEFWFQIYDDCTDKICAFFLGWKPEPDSGSPRSNDSKGSSSRRFQLLKEDERLADLISDNLTLEGSFSRNHKSFNSSNRLINKEFFIKDWEIVNLHELESKLKLEMEIEKDFKTLPILRNKSHILIDENLRMLNVNLIPRAVGYAWVKSFDTEENGFSLKHLYRCLDPVETPCLIVVQDTAKNIFGVMTDSKLYPSEQYYGTGECFLFTFYPSFKKYPWTGENNFFMRGNHDKIGFGCGEGYQGLAFDGDLLNGHSTKSRTFDNEPLTSCEYFTIAALEVWTFSETDD